MSSSQNQNVQITADGFGPSVYNRLTFVQQSKVLLELIESQTHKRDTFGKHGPDLFVFDLDGTLFDNRPRTCQIFHELAKSWEKKSPLPKDSTVLEKLSRIKPDSLHYLVTHSLKALGVNDPDLIHEGVAFWRERFFSNDYIMYDTPIPGAVEFTNACYRAGANLVYFTGRDLPHMGEGSFKSLTDHGFPIGASGTELVLKPYFEMSDEVFKRDFAPKLGRSGRVVAAFDNEPFNCNIFLECYPHSSVFFLDTQHFPDAPPLLSKVNILGDFRF